MFLQRITSGSIKTTTKVDLKHLAAKSQRKLKIHMDTTEDHCILQKVMSNSQTNLRHRTWESCTYQMAKQESKGFVCKHGFIIFRLFFFYGREQSGWELDFRPVLKIVSLNLPLLCISQRISASQGGQKNHICWLYSIQQNFLPSTVSLLLLLLLPEPLCFPSWYWKLHKGRNHVCFVLHCIYAA